MSRKDFYASPFGAAYSAYMERPHLSRLISRVVWGGDIKPYYENMDAVAEVAEGGTIVDCPCGAGLALRALRREAELRYVAADLSDAMLRRARKRAVSRGLGRVEFIEADAVDLPLRSGSADLFLSFWGLHCFDDPAAALAESARVLKPGGRLVASCFVRGDDSLRQVTSSVRVQATSVGLAPSQRSAPPWTPRVTRYRPLIAPVRCSTSTLGSPVSAPDRA